MDFVDLHIHTTASDGTEPPERIPVLAAEAGLKACAVTDHDTVAGVAAAQKAGEALGIRVLAGIEISTSYRNTEVHLLGYLLDIHSESLRPVLEWTVNDRDARNEKIMANLLRDGLITVTLEELKKEHPGTVIGRPHMAEAMLNAGSVSTIKEAFDRYLAEGKPYFLPRTYIPFAQAAEVIRQAGGIPVLAHPLQYGWRGEELAAFIRDAAEMGVKGVEVFYSGYTPEEIAELQRLGRENGLFFTGGSDFHGTRKPHIRLGTGTGDLRVPYAAVESLDRAHTENK